MSAWISTNVGGFQIAYDGPHRVELSGTIENHKTSSLKVVYSPSPFVREVGGAGESPSFSGEDPTAISLPPIGEKPMMGE